MVITPQEFPSQRAASPRSRALWAGVALALGLALLGGGWWFRDTLTLLLWQPRQLELPVAVPSLPDFSLLEDPDFRILRDFSAPLPLATSSRRTNPFAPI